MLIALARATTPALDRLAEGDEAWFADDRRAAVRAWREALALAGDAPADRAAEAMAHVRLVRFEGNLAPLWHEAALNRALDACPPTEPWCGVAWSDWELWMPSFVGADPARVPARLRGSPLVGPAEARRVQARGDPAGLAGLAALPAEALDGVGRGMVRTGRLRPPPADTWFIGTGIAVVPGLGGVGRVRFAHPDVGWDRHALMITADGSTLGGGSVAISGSLATATRPSASVLVARSRGWVWRPEPEPYTVDTAAAAYTQGFAVDRWAFRMGWTGRLDRHAGESTFTHGPRLQAEWSGEGLRLGASLTPMGGDYPFLYASAELAGRWSRGRTELRGRALGEATPIPETPFWRRPTAGGETLLRGLPAGRFRGPMLGAAQGEARVHAAGPVSVAGFVDLAAVDGVHLTAGPGLRLTLPPERWNVTRLDLGFGPEGWGLVLAWGEAW